ncbi:MAG: hypothetical protein ACO3R5_03335 [Pseudohongiellaceae bacterium]
MIAMAQERGIAVILLGVPAPAIFLSREAVYDTGANETGVVFIEDLVADVLSQPDKKSDAAHSNVAGYREMAETIAGVLTDQGAI